LGAPEELCKNPQDSFVYRFLGLSNFIPVEIVDGEMRVRSGAKSIPFPYPIPSGMGDGPFYAACRPMDITLSRGAADGGAQAGTGPGAGGALEGLVTRVIYLGNIYEYRVQVGDSEIRVQQDSFEAFKQGVFREGQVCALGIENIRYYRDMEEVS